MGGERQLQLGWWQACLSEKNNLSHRDLEHWGCDEAPACHHTEARKKAMFLFLQSIAGHSTETTPRSCWLWMVVVTVAGLLNGLVMEYQPSFILDIYSDQRSDWANPWKHWEQALCFSSCGVEHLQATQFWIPITAFPSTRESYWTSLNLSFYFEKLWLYNVYLIGQF